MSKVIGIDLGTTNSCVCVLEGGKPVVIPNAEGNRTTPSVVAFTKTGERLVGQVAKRQAITNPENTIFSIKRFMGLDWDNTTEERSRVPYKVVRNGAGVPTVQIGQETYSAPQISAIILQKLKADAESYLGDKVTKAVITVPAYFSDAQRQATKDAGAIAGLEVLRIINEPTASALAYGAEKDHDHKVLVFDLGGGTFDVSLLELGDGVFEVKATAGDNHLGGDDFDNVVMDWMVDEFRRTEGIDLKNDKMALQRLKEAAEKAKIELSSTTSTEINLPFITADASGPKHLNLSMTRAKFDELTASLVERTMGPVRRAMADSGLEPKDVDKILLVGGSTRIPAVQEAIRKYLNKEPDKSINPDEAVALGAALQAGVLAGEKKDILLLDVTPLSLGIETLGGVFTKLIERNTTIPTSKSQTFSTAADGQTSVEVHVLQGEREMAKDNITLGKFQLSGIPPAPRGVPQIEVKFDLDANGIVNVSAQDKATGVKQEITITNSGGLSKDQITAMKRDAERYAEEDKRRRELVEQRNVAEATVYTAEKMVREHGDRLPADTKEKLAEGAKAVKALLENPDNLDELTSKTEELNATVMGASSAMYANAGASTGAAPGGGAGGGASGGDDHVVDADYEEVK